MKNTITVDGHEYIRADHAGPPPVCGSRRVVVVDRGWIYAGDVERVETEIGPALRLTRVVWVFRWTGCGFDGVIACPESDSVELRPMAAAVQVPVASVVHTVEVGDSWGL